MISTDDYLHLADRALDGMVDIVVDLGDERANRRPPLPGANPPYAILVHCLGVMDYWAGQLVAGRRVERDREAEFAAAGPVSELPDLVAAARLRLRDDLRHGDPDAPLRDEPPARYADSPIGRRRGAALLHVLEELAQHHGQLEITRDLLLGAEAGHLSPPEGVDPR
ncbi:MAG: DinB family protein [Carbonactinosporaceae bacterium]